jgi:hypothetical protein
LKNGAEGTNVRQVLEKEFGVPFKIANFEGCAVTPIKLLLSIPDLSMKRIINFSIILITVLLIEACASHHPTKHKKLKPGKPIPCPQKDC